MNDLKEKCNLIARNSSVIARDEIRLFCQIMEWSYDDVYFVADDPHGVVSLGDYFFNMSDIHEVIANYPKLLERFGSNDELSNIIIRWYDWTLDYHYKHPVMEWVKIKSIDKFTGKPHYTYPEDGQEVMIKWGAKSSACLATFRKDMQDGIGRVHKYAFCPKRSDDFSKYYTNVLYGKSPMYWSPVTNPDERHYINLHSWLMGADELIEKGGQE